MHKITAACLLSPQTLTSNSEVTTTTSSAKKKEKKEQLTKAQKRRIISRTGASQTVHNEREKWFGLTSELLTPALRLAKYVDSLSYM